MKLGMFTMPSHPPERSLYDATEWDLEAIQYLDELGYDEVWIGEHFTSRWEPIPAPDLLIAQAIKMTKQIKLAPGGHVLPFHHPVELAHRVAYLDHLAKGRFMFGAASGGFPNDLAIFDIDGKNKENRKMLQESLDIIMKLWNDEEPFEYKGQFWNATKTQSDQFAKYHVYPYQKPHPPIGVTGLSPSSEMLTMAGEKGFIPLSFGYNTDYVASHWKAYEDGAKKSGKTADRSNWRIARDVFVADTDEEAIEGSIGSMMGRQHREYWVPLFASFNYLSLFKHDPSVDDSEVDTEYVAKHNWFVGSPETVAEQLFQLYQKVGGFGKLLVVGYDYSTDADRWKKSMRLLKEEVVPRVEHKLSKVNV